MFRHTRSLIVGALLRGLPPALRQQPSVAASIYKRNFQPALAQSNHITNAQKILTENRPLSAQEWQAVRAELLACGDRSITEVNIDATILGLCTPQGLLQAGKSYVDYVRASGKEVNLASTGRLLRLYHMGEVRGVLSDADREDIVRICQDLHAKSASYDAHTSESMLHALVATASWRQALPLLETIKLTARPSTSAYSVLAARAFADNEPEIGWRVLAECLASDRVPKCEVFTAYWQWCAGQKERRVPLLTQMLQFIGDNGLVVSRRVVDELAAVFEEAGSRCKVVNIGDKGQCPACRHHLSAVFLSNREFKQISSVFLQEVLLRNNVFVKSSPAEVAKFEQFLAVNPAFDCVIDGLNVAYSTGNNKPAAYYGKLVAAVVRFFVEQNKRVLVLGRKHMLRWPKGGMGYVQANAKVFLTDDLSQDDPFLLYATLRSGPATHFVSRDLMRGHAHLLGPELKAIFRRWQQEHQYCLDQRSHAGRINIQEPIKFQTNAHFVDGSWHVPFTDVYSAAPADTFELPSSWLCIPTQSPVASSA